MPSRALCVLGKGTIMNSLKLFLTTAVLAVSSGAASAAVIYADTVLGTSAGAISDGAATPGVRTDPDNALGAPDGAFYSVGIGGSIDLGFSGMTFNGGGKVTSYEITFGLIYTETADVYALLGGGSTLIGSISNAQAATGGATLTFGGAFDGIRIVDTSSNPPSLDGFDVDAVGVKPIPLPAAGVMLLGGLAGFGALRRRKTA